MTNYAKSKKIKKSASASLFVASSVLAFYAISQPVSAATMDEVELEDENQELVESTKTEEVVEYSKDQEDTSETDQSELTSTQSQEVEDQEAENKQAKNREVKRQEVKNKEAENQTEVDSAPAPAEKSLGERAAEIETSSDFFNEVAPFAVEVADEYNVYPSVMMAQAALESGWGKSGLASAPNHNMFGIKGKYEGQSVTMDTNEYTNGRWIRLPQEFRKYPSYAESFEDNAKLLRNGLTWNKEFYAGTWRERTEDYRDSTQWLTGRYATAPNYASSLNRIIEQYGLQRYDDLATTPQAASVDVQSTTRRYEETASPEELEFYTVRRGDNLSKISRQFQTSVSELKGWNNLRSDLILVGQDLRVKAPTVQELVQPKEEEAKATSTSYTVQAGDTLSAIAQKSNTSLQKLVQVNQLANPNHILVGQTIKLAENKAEQADPFESANKKRVYTVKSGDNLGRIARAHGTSVSQLVASNEINNPNLIVVGQKLTIPSTSSKGTSSAPAVKTQLNYKVKSGDSLYSIAKRHGQTVSTLAKLNNLANPNLIVVGQTLRVR